MKKIETLLDILLLGSFCFLIFIITRPDLTQPILTWSSDKSYLTISVPNEASGRLKLSGQTLLIGNKEVVIPKGALNFVSGEINENNNIWLAPGESATLNLGASPLGVSFRENLCSGYLSEFQKFSPPFELMCPRKTPPESCQNLPPICQTPKKSGLPLTPECLNYVLELNYNSCLSNNLHTANFFGQWRIYLNLDPKIVLNKNDKLELQKHSPR